MSSGSKSSSPAARDLEHAVSHSFLNRVPDFLVNGRSMEEAVRLAFDHEEQFLVRLQLGQDETSREIRRLLCDRVYRTLRQPPAAPEGGSST